MSDFCKALLAIYLVGCLAGISNGQLMCFHCDDCDTALVEIVQCGPNRPMIPFPDGSLPTTTVPPLTTTVVPETTTLLPPSIPTVEPETTTLSPPSIPTVEPTTTVVPETTTLWPPSVPTIEPDTTTITPPTIPTVEPDTTTITPPTLPTVEPDTTTITPPTLPTVEPDTTTISTTPGSPILTPPTHPTFTPEPPGLSTPGSPILTPPTHPTPSPGASIAFGIVIPVPPNNTQYACLSVKRTDVNNRSVTSKGCAQLMTSVSQTCTYATNGGHSSCTVCLGSLCNAFN